MTAGQETTTPLQTAVEREARYYMHTFRRQPVVLVRGEGCWVWDDAGRRYLDLVAGIAVSAVCLVAAKSLRRTAATGNTEGAENTASVPDATRVAVGA